MNVTNRSKPHLQTNGNTTFNKTLTKIRNGVEKISPKNDKQIEFVQKIRKCDWIIASGPPGVGRTFLSVVIALDLITEKKSKYNKIVFIRPAVNCDNEKIGYLPGTVEEKLEPYMRPCTDILRGLLKVSEKELDKMLERGILQVIPLAHVRGLTYDYSIVIVDQAQNATEKQLDAVISRMGKKSKIIINGDPHQCDIQHVGDRCALSKKIQQFNDADSTRVATIEFDIGDIVRNKMIGQLINKDGCYPTKENYAGKLIKVLSQIKDSSKQLAKTLGYLWSSGQQQGYYDQTSRDA